MSRLEKISQNPVSRLTGSVFCAAIATGLVGLAMRQAGLSVNLSSSLLSITALWAIGGSILDAALRQTRTLDRTTIFFLTVAIGLPAVFCIIFGFAVAEHSLHGVLETNNAFNWPVYLGEYLLMLMPGLTAGAACFAWSAAQTLPPTAEATDDVENRLRKDWWDWFWLQPLIMADIAVISSIILGAGTLARRLSAWLAINLLILCLIQLLLWLVLRRSGKQPGFFTATLLIGLPFINWVRLPTLQEHGPEAVGGAVGMWTLALLSAVAISAKRLWPMVTVVCLSTMGFVTAYFLHQHADAWFEQALISLLSGSFCIALVFAVHGRARQSVRDQSILAQALQRERAANEAAQRETDRRHRVLRAVGHDLRQPLSALQLWLFSAGQKPGNSATDFQAINSAVSSAHEILDSISQLAWINDAEKEPKFENVSLAKLMAELGAELRLNAKEAGVRLSCEPLDVIVRTDPLLLRRILRNFLLNAIKHGNDEVILAAERKGDKADIYVSDNGPGISQESQAAIFDEFARGAKKDGDGFGIGLAVAKDLAMALDHQLTLESALGEGATFSVQAPVVSLPAVSQEIPLR